MPAVSLSPIFNGYQAFSSAGIPLTFGTIDTFQAGTSTPLATYTTAAGNIANANPITLLADGRPPQEIWLQNGFAYRFVLKDFLGNQIGSYDDIRGASTDTTLRANLSNTVDPSDGDALIGVKRTDIASAVGMTLHDWNNRSRVNVRQVGVAGDGSTDDSTLLNALGVLGVPLFIPYTSTGYKINSTVTFSCDVYCEGFFVPDAAIGSAPNDYNRFAVVLASAGFGVGRRFVGIKVQGSGALRTALVSGIRNDCEDSVARDCRVVTLNYGIVARSYSQTYDKCSAQLCNTNLSAYARSTSLEINSLCIRGGAYDSAVNAALNIGDTSWSDALAAGANPHGVAIEIMGVPSFDGAPVKIDNVYSVRVGGYFEGSATGTAIQLGGSGDGNLRDVEVTKSYFSTLQYAVKCGSGINGLTVRKSFYTNVTRSALYLVSDLYAYTYERGVPTASFTQGQEVHTGFRSLGLGSVQWGQATIDYQGLQQGIQRVTADMGMWYPAGQIVTSNPTVSTMNASSAARFYTTPATAKAGTVSGGTTFTFTTLADCYAFNGGDRITTAPAGCTYVRSVDYATGVMVMDGGVTANGAATVSQTAASFGATTVTYSGAAPASGTWARGDSATNGVASVGTPKGWLCTASGMPGTWVSTGNL